MPLQPYCISDTLEFLIIANKQENLVFPMQTQNFEAGDFDYDSENLNSKLEPLLVIKG